MVGTGEQVAVWRGDPYRSRHDGIALRRLLHFEVRVPAEYVGHQAAMAWVEVLDDQDRRRKGRSEPLEQTLQCDKPTGRRGDSNDVKSWHGRAPISARPNAVIVWRVIAYVKLTP